MKATSDAENYLFSDQVGYLLRRAYQRHVAIFHAEASDSQLTSVQFSTLCALRDGGPQSQVELVRATSVDQATIRGIINRLKARGLVAFSRHATDRRKIVVEITEAGRATLDEMIPRARKITELTMKRLDPAERMALLRTLRLMLEDGDD